MLIYILVCLLVSASLLSASLTRDLTTNINSQNLSLSSPEEEGEERGRQSDGEYCLGLSDCVTCTELGNRRCVWMSVADSIEKRNSKCVSRLDSRNKPEDQGIFFFGDTCPIAWPTDPPAFLPFWMGQLSSVIGDLTLLDISLPGTHDTLTDRLSLQTSVAGIDGAELLAEVMHNYTSRIPNELEDYIRKQAQTQALDITRQLDNGVRFVDFRMMYEYTDENPEWFSLHFMQSKSRAIDYFSQIKDWVAAHPTELVVLWLSKHGSECATGLDQYPNTTVESKRNFWQEIVEVFGPLLVDFDYIRVNETSISSMVQQNRRVVIYASDYLEFTGGSSLALDGCKIDNRLGPSVSDEPSSLDWEREMFQSAESIKAQDKPDQKLFLMSMAAGVPGEQMIYAAKIHWLPYDESDVQKCASAFNIPGLDWCPETLLDISQLDNYYKQITLDEAILDSRAGFPNAIYLNGLDWDGTIRTGTTVPWGAARSNNTDHTNTAFAYADTLILYNIKMVCDPSGIHYSKAKAGELSEDCLALTDLVKERRAKHPLQRWDDAVFGRLSNWP